MSEQAEKFLAQWEIEHVKIVARSDRKDEAGRLALRRLVRQAFKALRRYSALLVLMICPL